jgi:hypothetical protein
MVSSVLASGRSVFALPMDAKVHTDLQKGRSFGKHIHPWWHARTNGEGFSKALFGLHRFVEEDRTGLQWRRVE